MKIAISGGTGFIGTHLSVFLKTQGFEVVGIGREYFREEAKERLENLISETDVVINLAGAPINKRWTKQYRQILHDSRILPLRMLTEAINHTSKVKLLISASAVGYYPSSGCYDEHNAVKGNGFLADLCEIWEKEAIRVRSSVRLAITRFGVVLAPDGGAFPQMLLPVCMGTAAVIGTGKQFFAWIGLQDLMRAISFIISQPEMNGIFNFAAPAQITNAGFTKALARHYHAWIKIKVPAFVFRLRYGGGAVFLTQGQCVHPARLLETGFRFQTPTIEDFLKSL